MHFILFVSLFLSPLPPICHLPPCLHIVQDYRMSSSLDEWPTNFLNTVAEPQARIGGGTMLAFSTFSYYMSHWHILNSFNSLRC